MANPRMCSFCNRTADYDDFPDDSVCWIGICACAECLENGKAKDFREILEPAEILIEA